MSFLGLKNILSSVEHGGKLSISNYFKVHFVCTSSTSVSTPQSSLRQTYSTTAFSKKNVRVRFAPSPTGHLHLGGLRTALYNYLLARSTGGTFILRIEDTDRSRLVPGSTESICEMLNWAGLVPDEGPMEGGSKGPYVQSERRELHIKHAMQLIETGAAYSFSAVASRLVCCIDPPLLRQPVRHAITSKSTTDGRASQRTLLLNLDSDAESTYLPSVRLELLRKDSTLQQNPKKYDNRCRTLTEAKKAELLRQGAPFCVRLKLREVPGHTDAVYGLVQHPVVQEGDPIILKTDGQATYHLANVVDDHHMDISHVVRGEEWLTSTPKHLLLYENFKWEPPTFAHLPLLFNSDGTKLSKRHDTNRVEHLRSAGYSSRTLLNLVAGGGVVDRNKDAIYTLPELVDKFDLSRLSRNKTQLDTDRLTSLGRLDVQRSVTDEAELEQTMATLRDLVQEHCGLSPGSPALSPSYFRRVLLSPAVTLGALKCLPQLVDERHLYLWRPPTPGSAGAGASHVCIKCLLQHLEQLSASAFTKEAVLAAVKVVQKEASVKRAPLMKALRLALCGTTEGNPVGDVLEILGREESLQRLRRALDQGLQDTPVKDSLDDSLNELKNPAKRREQT